MRVVKAFGQTARSFKRLSDAIKDYTGLSLDVTLFFRNSMPGFTAVLNLSLIHICFALRYETKSLVLASCKSLQP